MSDAKMMVPFYNDPHASKFTHIPYPYTLKDAKKHLKDRISKFGKDSYDFFAFDKKTGEFIASLGIVNIEKRDNKAHIGYFVAKNQRGKGYCTEACTSLLDFGFNKIKLHRININHVKGNIGSKKVILKLGCKFEGVEREGSKPPLSKKYQDHLLYAILDWEWKRRRKNKKR